MKTVQSLALALAFAASATAAGAQVAGGVTGQVGAEVQVPDPRPTLEDNAEQAERRLDELDPDVEAEAGAGPGAEVSAEARAEGEVETGR